MASSTSPSRKRKAAAAQSSEGSVGEVVEGAEFPEISSEGSEDETKDEGMTDDKNETADEQSPPDRDRSEEKYPLDRLVAEATEWFGPDVTSHQVAGALSADRRRRNFTLAEAEELVTGWNTRPVETEEDH